MSTDACLVFYGLRLPVDDDDVELLESESHPLLRQAQQAGLGHYWASFGPADEGRWLFIGHEVCCLGPEHDRRLDGSPSALLATFQAVDDRLKRGGFTGAPNLYFQWRYDA